VIYAITSKIFTQRDINKKADLDKSMVSTIGVIGDVHGETERLERSLGYLQNLKTDVIICTGDIVDGRGDIDESVRLLEKYTVSTVLGNQDDWFLKNTMRNLPEATPLNAVNENTRAFLQHLPVEMEFETPAGRILLCHGLGKRLMAKVGEDDYGYALENNFELHDLINSRRFRFVVNGHTHRRMARDYGGLTVVNGGSLLYEDACFQTINFQTGQITIYKVDIPEEPWEKIAIPGFMK
jgi:putative phosphoesterase